MYLWDVKKGVLKILSGEEAKGIPWFLTGGWGPS